MSQLREMYENHNVNFLTTMERIASRNRTTQADCDEISYIYTTDRHTHIENSQFDGCSSYLNVYAQFANEMLNKKGIRNQTAFGGKGNIFSWTDTAWSYKNGKSDELLSLMEIADQRTAFKDTMKDIFQSGYDVLEQAISFEKDKTRNAALMYDAQIKVLQAQMTDDLSYAQRKALQDQIDDLENKFSTFYTRANAAASDYSKLKTLKSQIDTMIENQEKLIGSQTKTFKDNMPSEKVEYYGTEFKSQEVKVEKTDSKGEKVYTTVKVYPHGVNGKVEYRDQYGNLYATQTLKKASTISPNKMKVGGEYVIRLKTTWGSETREVTVTKIDEVENGFSNFFRQTLNPVHWISGVSPATNRTIFYTYVKDGKTHNGKVTIAALEQFTDGASLKTGNAIKYEKGVTAV